MIIRTILAVVLLLFGAFITFANYGFIYENHKNYKNGIDRHHSFVPILAPVGFIAGGLLLPYSFGRYFCFAPLLDPGTIVLIVGLPYLLIQYIRERND